MHSGTLNPACHGGSWALGCGMKVKAPWQTYGAEEHVLSSRKIRSSYTAELLAA